MEKLTFDGLTKLSNKELNAIHEAGTAPTWSSVNGWEFRGYNVLDPIPKALMWVLSNVRFIKVFYEDTENNNAKSGVNLKVSRGGLADPWTCLPAASGDGVGKIGWYNVYEQGEGNRGEGHPQNALFIDYKKEGNTLLTGKGLKDYLVQVDPNNPDLLLGKAYMTSLPSFLAPPNFFVLERFQKYER